MLNESLAGFCVSTEQVLTPDRCVSTLIPATYKTLKFREQPR